VPVASANGVDMYYEIHGEGEPLVLIDGLGSDHKTLLAFQVPSFAQHYRCILPNNRGVGLTDKPDAPYSTALMADDAAALLDSLGVESAHVAGWSMGGAITQHLAARHPDKVRTAMLHGTWARTDRYLAWQLERRRPILESLGREELYRNLLLTAFTPRFFNEQPEKIEAELEMMLAAEPPQPEHAYLRQLDACIAHDAEDALAGVRVPTLITVGAEDRLIAPRFSHRLKELLPHAELVVFEDGAHSVSEEHPEPFNEVCLDFLGRHA